ncbi:MAG: AAA family ATPase, partial [Methylobacter sp.]|nr:AAA family ATPase [Methylobacter sp.]
MARKKLPIGIQTFAKIREDHYYYVDKTPLILKLVSDGTHYFLSRPRRFGKSLLIDTLGELFAGNEPLFRGLFIHDKWDWSIKYPVIRLSFGGGVIHDRAHLDRRIFTILDNNQVNLSVNCQHTDDIGDFFESLIKKTVEQTGRRVVILVDEYDKPILDNLAKPEIAKEIRDGLRNLYSVIKDSDAHVKFAMLTGVSKFSKVSLFSGLNNLRDITLATEFSSICGYTDDDIDTLFAPELEGLDREKIRYWYNGYNWTGQSVYNPFDVLLLFQSREFKNHWFETGSPTFLIDLLCKRQTFTPNLDHMLAAEALLSAFDVEQIATEALLFQTGYLTIDSVRHLASMTQFKLRYPNHEVRSSLNEAMLYALTAKSSEYGVHAGQLYDFLVENNFDGLNKLFTAFFASIPNDWYRNNPIAQYEGYYASIFYSYFAALGLDIILEDVTNFGRIDMT